MYEILLAIFLIIAISLIGLIMLQQGKSVDIGNSFGAAASGTLFGSSGSSNFMTRITAILTALFFIFSLILGNLNRNKTSEKSKNVLELSPTSEEVRSPQKTLIDDKITTNTQKK